MKFDLGEEVKLTVYLKDGRVLSGTYPMLCAAARLDFARTLPQYAAHKWEQAHAQN